MGNKNLDPNMSTITFFLIRIRKRLKTCMKAL